ncbi:MAG: ABC transporter permease, partial [Phyllobacteriaceae bacterium]|nr:ABC transporter permease [Phyllobacteriaceae bacterium]
MSARGELPTWADVALIPLLNLLVALLISGVVVLMIGENPLEAMWIMLKGAVGTIKGWGYMLYYATNFIFTGLAVAIAFHAGLFNIGGEGQAYFAGLGATIAGLSLEFLPWPIVIPIAILASAAFGA